MNYAVQIPRPQGTSSERSFQSLQLRPPRLPSPRLSSGAPVNEEESPGPTDDWQADDEGAPQRLLIVDIHEVWDFLPTETSHDLGRVLLRIAKRHQDSERHSRGTSP